MTKTDNWKKLLKQLHLMNGNFNMALWLRPDREGETVREALQPAACLAGTAYLLAKVAGPGEL
jgi:hypothetical protein